MSESLHREEAVGGRVDEGQVVSVAGALGVKAERCCS